METTLRAFYARAIAFLLYALCVAALAFIIVTPAWAQEATPAAAEPATDVLDLAFSTASAFVVSLIGALLAVATRYAPQWVVAIVDHLTTSEAVKWENLLTSGLDRAEAYARARLGDFHAKNRLEAVAVMAGFLNAFNPEIVRWADQNKNGVFDLIESRLPPTGPRTTPAAVAPLKRKGEVN